MVSENVRGWIKSKVALHNKYVDMLVSDHMRVEYEDWIAGVWDPKDGPAPPMEEWEKRGNYTGAGNAFDLYQLATSVFCDDLESLFDEFGATFDFSIEMSEDCGKLDWRHVVDVFENVANFQGEDTRSLAAVLKQFKIPTTVTTKTSYVKIALHEKAMGHDRYFGVPST